MESLTRHPISENDSIQANIKTIGELDFQRLDIPFYQRPYRWNNDNVVTLLNCIYNNMDKEEYRIGSIILNPHDNDDKLDIVDGQQRLITLSLIFMYLDSSTSLRLSCEFNVLDSKQNIYRNYQFIKDWFESHNVDKVLLAEFLKDKCTVVEIIARDLSEAFQMFDSQNGRGKELEAYNLLKAYHLRAIENETSRIAVNEDKKEIDRQWEAAVLMRTFDDDTSLLKYIVNDLYRIRRWSRKKRGYNFGKSKINEFKGIQFNKSESILPLNNLSFLLYLHFCETKGSINENNGFACRSPRRLRDQNPFVSINMDIINGQLFFSYIQTYISSYNYLFKSDICENSPLWTFRRDFEKYCCRYRGAQRTGDTYLREVYMALILALYDRFGEQYVAKWYTILYTLIYRKRLEQYSIFYSTIVDFPIPYFEIIANTVDPSGLQQLASMSKNVIACKRLGDREYDIAYFITHTGVTINIVANDLNIGNRILNKDDIITDQDF